VHTLISVSCFIFQLCRVLLLLESSSERFLWPG